MSNIQLIVIITGILGVTLGLCGLFSVKHMYTLPKPPIPENKNN